MSSTPIQQSVPRYLDPRKFAQQGVHIGGVVAVSELLRFADALVRPIGKVTVDVGFEVNEQGIRVLTGTIESDVQLTCQRCLEPMEQRVSCNVNLAFVWDEQQARQLPKYLDPWIAEEGVLDFYEVMEEELLLALPIVAYHDKACIEPSLYSSSDDQQEDETAVLGNSPFQVLKQLKGSPKT